MVRYHVNRTPQPNGDHEVHKEGCYWLSLALDTKDLGIHASCQAAVEKAREYFPETVNGCKSCSRQCHSS